MKLNCKKKRYIETNMSSIFKLLDEYFQKEHGFGFDLDEKEKRSFIHDALYYDCGDDMPDAQFLVKKEHLSGNEYFEQLENNIFTNKSFRPKNIRDYGDETLRFLLCYLCSKDIIEEGEYMISG